MYGKRLVVHPRVDHRCAMGQSHKGLRGRVPQSMDDPRINTLNQYDLFMNAHMDLDLNLMDVDRKKFYGLAIRMGRDTRRIFLTYHNSNIKASSDLLIKSCDCKHTILKGVVRGLEFKMTFKSTKFDTVIVQLKVVGYAVKRLHLTDDNVRSINAKLYNLSEAHSDGMGLT